MSENIFHVVFPHRSLYVVMYKYISHVLLFRPSLLTVYGVVMGEYISLVLLFPYLS